MYSTIVRYNMYRLLGYMIQYQHIESVHIVSSRIRSDPSRSQGSQSTHYSFLGVFFVLQALLFLSLCTSSHYNFMCWVNSLVAASCRVIGHYSNFILWMDFPLFSSFLISLKSSFLSLQILVQKANSSVALHPLLYLVWHWLVSGMQTWFRASLLELFVPPLSGGWFGFPSSLSHCGLSL